MSGILKVFIIALFVLPLDYAAIAQPLDRPSHPMLPPGMKYDTIRRKDADNWEYIQVRMPEAMAGAMKEMVITEGTLHNGIMEGSWIDFWENGAPRFIVNYSNGKKTGISLETDPTGALLKMETFKNDMLEGPSRSYAPHLGVVTDETYYSQGKRHGKHKKWYAENRTLQEEGTYVNGILEGPAIWYYDDGQKSVEYSYHNGKLNGPASVYYKDGKVSEMGEYKDDVQSGHWKEFYENGNIKEEGEYVNGEKEGVWKQYDEQGKFTQNAKYKKGELSKK